MSASSHSVEQETHRRRWSGWGRLRLRPKLILAFSAIAAMAGLCGAIGLLFVTRSTTTVEEFTEITSPLLTESLALVESAQRTRSMFLSAIAKGDNIEQASTRLSDLRSDTLAHIAELRRLSSRANIDIQLATVEQSERAFSEMLAATMQASLRERSAVATATAQFDRYQMSYKKLEPVLTFLADRAEANVTKAEDVAKVQVQTRTATVDGLGDLISGMLNNTYPIVQNANRLLRELERTDDRAKVLSSLSGAEQLSAIEQDIRRSFRIIGSISKKLASRLRDSEGQESLTAIRQGFAEIEDAILGSGGLLQSERDKFTAMAEIAAGRQLLDQVESGYFAVLDNVEIAVRRLNVGTEAKTVAQIAQALTVTAAGVLFTIVAGAVFSLLFAYRLTGPLIRMTEQVEHVRKSGELKALPDPSVANRGDEVGTLSRSFNEMIMALAAARQELIARSEAEISKQYERLNLAINSMPQGLCMFDADQKLIISNKRYAGIYGLRPDQTVTGTSLHALLELGEAESAGGIRSAYLSEEWERAITSGRPWHNVIELRDGRSIAISHLPVPSGGSIATHEDITERRKAEAQIAYMAQHDMLTGLPNRVQFQDDMQQALAAMSDNPVAVLSLDLDHFKNVNDTLGHPVGDGLLKAVAQRLRLCLRPEDKVARLGGDEFAVIQIGAKQPLGSTALAERLIRELSEPFTVDDHQIVTGATVGISLAPDDGSDADRLIKNADLALYRAKEEERGTYRFFEPEMDARMQARHRLELDLRKALLLGEFELFYQPLVKLESGTVSACEALLQWRHPERGLVPWVEFIPLAEEIGLLNQIGAWALEKACSEAQSWPNDIKVAVNLSASQFKSGTLVRDVVSALERSGLPANRLELEITEHILLDETVSTLVTLNQLRNLGVRISMDDFGIGYSSLGYLRKFPFDKIKINPSIVTDVASGAHSVAILRAVAGLSNTLGIATTAEGVETEAQLQWLKKEGCTEAQGALFSEPMTAADLKRKLEHPLH